MSINKSDWKNREIEKWMESKKHSVDKDAKIKQKLKLKSSDNAQGKPSRNVKKNPHIFCLLYL